jgi:hypothetical protein
MLTLAERILVAGSRAESSRTGADAVRRHHESLHVGCSRISAASADRDGTVCGDIVTSSFKLVLFFSGKLTLAFFLLRTRRSLWALRLRSRMRPSPLLNLSVNGLPHLRTRRGMKQGFEERQIARAKVIFSARLPSSAGFFLLRFLIHKPNPLQSAKSKLA